VRAVGLVEKPQIPLHPPVGPDPSSAFLRMGSVVFTEGEKSIPFYQGELLQTGNLIAGSAVILRTDTTILLNERDTAEIDSALNVLIRVE
jgi:N-methylhydantoinase A/oxoprolinase/acetone carboxylase beta subunit